MTTTQQLAALLVALVGIAGCLLAGHAYAAAPADAVRVVRVIDGDTVDVRHLGGRVERVRLVGIDTPETVHPARRPERGGREATAFARRTLAGQRVTMAPDPSQDRSDCYGRTLAYLTLPDGRDYSVEAARAGVARSYVYGRRPPTAHARIVAAEHEARSARRGLWS